MNKTTRDTHVTAITINLPNPVQMPQFAEPLLTTVDVLKRDGQPIGMPMMHQTPAIADDFTDEMLALVNDQLKTVGLTISRA